MKAAIYARVSTTDQNCDLQLDAVREYIARHGWENAGEYVDEGWSGAKASRPKFDKLMEDAGKRRFDVVLVWKLDRFARSMLNCETALQHLKGYRVRFIATSQGIDTDESSPAAKLMQQIFAAFAEFEREMIRERVAAGLKRYRQDYGAGRVGKEVHSRSGKNLPVGRPMRVFDREKVRALGPGAQLSRNSITVELGRWYGTSDPPGLERLSKAAPKPFSGYSVSQAQSKDLPPAPEGPPNLQGCGAKPKSQTRAELPRATPQGTGHTCPKAYP